MVMATTRIAVSETAFHLPVHVEMQVAFAAFVLYALAVRQRPWNSLRHAIPGFF